MGKRIVVAVVGILFAIYIAAAPYITIHQMRSAAERQDWDALSEHIDFPSLRQSLKDQINAMFIKELAKDDMKNNAFAALGAAFAGVMVDRMVEAYVTPAGITQLMTGERPNSKEMSESRSVPVRKPLSGASMAYESLDKFVVKVKDDNGAEGKFVLRRRGIGWKITEIVIPLDK